MFVFCSIQLNKASIGCRMLETAREKSFSASVRLSRPFFRFTGVSKIGFCSLPSVSFKV